MLEWVEQGLDPKVEEKRTEREALAKQRCDYEHLHAPKNVDPPRG